MRMCLTALVACTADEISGKISARIQDMAGLGAYAAEFSDCVPYDESTKLCGAMLGALQENISMFRTEDDTQINMYCVIPLYKEEMEYQKLRGQRR